jgi:hypothetical protein
MDITLESASTDGATLSGSNTGHMAKETLLYAFFCVKKEVLS